MIETHEETYHCEICEGHFHKLPLGGVSLEESLWSPVRICPECGPVDLDVMQFCREAIVRNFEN